VKSFAANSLAYFQATKLGVAWRKVEIGPNTDFLISGNNTTKIKFQPEFE
jgi:hypothetical protein